MLLHAPQQSLQILWDLNCKSFLVLPTELLFPCLMGRRKSPLKAGSSLSSTIVWCSPSSFCRAGEVSPGHGGWQVLYGGTKVHLKWVGHELLEEDNLLWLAGQRPGQMSACAGCDKGEGELQKASCVPLRAAALCGDETHLPIFPLRILARPCCSDRRQSQGCLASGPGCRHGVLRVRAATVQPPRDAFPGGARREAQAAMWSREGLPRAISLRWLLDAVLAMVRGIPCLTLFLPGV